MSRVALSAAIVLSLSCCCVAQETKSGFEFLKQFEGKWWSEAVAPTTDSGGEPATKTSVVGKTVGNFWLVMEHRGQFGEMKFNAIQTVGYDKEKKQYVGTWIDSVKDYMWHYTGELDGNRLVLIAKGPDWNDESRMRMYRDIYEFESSDEIKASSQMKNDDGKWETFMTAKMHRVKMSSPLIKDEPNAK